MGEVFKADGTLVLIEQLCRQYYNMGETDNDSHYSFEGVMFRCEYEGYGARFYLYFHGGHLASPGIESTLRDVSAEVNRSISRSSKHIRPS